MNIKLKELLRLIHTILENKDDFIYKFEDGFVEIHYEELEKFVKEYLQIKEKL